MKLLALIMAFGLFYAAEKSAPLKSFNWVVQLHNFFTKHLNHSNLSRILTLAFPLLMLFLLNRFLFDFSPQSISYLLLQIAIVYYCLGPETIMSIIKRKQTKTQLGLSAETKPEELIYKLTDAALHRWFGVFFWYVVLNIYGALFYRMVCVLAQANLDEPAAVKFKYILKLIEFPVTIIMTVSLALASDFDRIWRHCKQYLTVETLKSLNSQYMYKSMDFAVEQCEIEKNDENLAQIVELTTYQVLKRMLVVWLVFAALMVIFAKG